MLNVTESFLRLRLKAACLDAKSLPQPTCSIYEPRIMKTPARASALDKIYHKFLEFNEASIGKPILWNVGYNRLGNEQEFVSFSTSLNGLTVRVEIHKPQTAYNSESLRVLCEPMISLSRANFLLEELMEPQNFISDVIHPAILEEVRDTKISFCDDEKM